MKNHTEHENRMLNTFLSYWPSYKDRIVTYSKWDTDELRVSLNDGSTVLWNNISQGARFYKPTNWSIDDEKQFYRSFGARLNVLIFNRGHSVGEIASASGLTKAMVYKYLNGESVPSAYNLLKLAVALNCEVEEFFRFAKKFE